MTPVVTDARLAELIADFEYLRARGQLSILNSDLLDALRHYQQLRAAEQDALRYRWLRHGENDELVLLAYGGIGPRPFDPKVDTIYLPRGERLDAAIDAAMAK